MYRLEWNQNDQYVLYVQPREIPLGVVFQRTRNLWCAAALPGSIEVQDKEEARQWVEDKVRENLTQLLEASQ